jgi:hypothetical protein
MNFYNNRWRNGDFPAGKKIVTYKDSFLQTEDPEVIEVVKGMPEWVEMPSDAVSPVKVKTIRGARTSIEKEEKENE